MFSYFQLFLHILEYIWDRFVRLLRGETKIDEVSVDGKVAIVTGANSGLGKETALALAQRGATVILACRNLTSGEQVADEIVRKSGCSPSNLVLKELDLASLDSVRRFATSVKREFHQVSLLILNAGVYFDSDDRKVTQDGFEAHMGVNHLGHFYLTNLLLDVLKRGAPSRVVVVSSTNQLIAELDLDDVMLERRRDFGFQNTIPYNNSKKANSLFAMELGRRLAGTGVTTYSMCPGLVNTDVFRNLSTFRRFYTRLNILLVGLSAKQGAETILYCALDKGLNKETGQVYRFGKHFTSALQRLDPTEAEQLWLISERLVRAKHSY
jgi:NAD(P)-dependent dehydrogenase (short-subunit alcohol dehydrogenase family)